MRHTNLQTDIAHQYGGAPLLIASFLSLAAVCTSKQDIVMKCNDAVLFIAVATDVPHDITFYGQSMIPTHMLMST